MTEDFELSYGTRPNVIIPGVQKSGTTFLAELLSQHPDVFVPVYKEPCFFAAVTQPVWRYPNGDLRHFAIDTPQKYERLYQGQESRQVRIDATTDYLKVPQARDLIARHCPGAKIVLLLRDPVERAFSAFNFYRQNGQEDLDTFSEAWRMERERLDGGRLTWSPYVATGFYAETVLDWQAAFGAENVLVVLFDDLRADPMSCLKTVSGFLGLSDFAFDPAAGKNASVVVRSPFKKWVRDRLFGGSAYGSLPRRISRAMLPEELRIRLRRRIQQKFINTAAPRAARLSDLPMEDEAALRKIYEEDIEKLEKITGYDLGSWKRRDGECSHGE